MSLINQVKKNPIDIIYFSDIQSCLFPSSEIVFGVDCTLTGLHACVLEQAVRVRVLGRDLNIRFLMWDIL